MHTVPLDAENSLLVFEKLFYSWKVEELAPTFPEIPRIVDFGLIIPKEVHSKNLLISSPLLFMGIAAYMSKTLLIMEDETKTSCLIKRFDS